MTQKTPWSTARVQVDIKGWHFEIEMGSAEPLGSSGPTYLAQQCREQILFLVKDWERVEPSLRSLKNLSGEYVRNRHNPLGPG